MPMNDVNYIDRLEPLAVGAFSGTLFLERISMDNYVLAGLALALSAYCFREAYRDWRGEHESESIGEHADDV